MYKWKKFTNESKGKPEQKFDAAFGTTLRISKCFQRSKKQKIYSTCDIIPLHWCVIVRQRIELTGLVRLTASSSNILWPEVSIEQAVSTWVRLWMFRYLVFGLIFILYSDGVDYSLGTADDELWPLIQGKLDVLNKVGLSKDNFKVCV